MNVPAERPVRVAAVGDLHVTTSTRPAHLGLGRVREHADVLLLAGDLTDAGRSDEGRMLAEALADLGVTVVAVLGNHDHDDGDAARISAMLQDAGVLVLDGTAAVLDVHGVGLGIAGVMGCAGGFGPARRDTAEQAEQSARLRRALEELDTGLRIALTHFAPVAGTLAGEPPEIHHHLGSDHLGRAVDAAGADLAVHGHARLGTERGSTPGAVPVRNVARPVLGRPYAVYRLPPPHPPRPMGHSPG